MFIVKRALSVILLLLCGLSIAQSYSIARNEETPGTIRGRLLAVGVDFGGAKVFLHLSDGRELQTFVDHAGWFAFANVPPGVHLLQPFHKSILYPEIRIEVSKRQQVTRATLSLNRHVVLRQPFLLQPLSDLVYVEKRKAFDLKGLLFSPYGLMISVSIFAIFIFPMMKVDPEEYKAMQEQLKAPSSSPRRSIGAATKKD